MKAVKLMIGGGIAAAALATAAPAAAQYYPGYGYGYPYGGNVVGQVVNQVLGGGYGGYGGYGYAQGNSRLAASQCMAAVQQRMGGYAGYGYGNPVPVSVTSVQIVGGGGYKVRGVTSMAAGYGGYGQTRFSCRTDFRGLVIGLNFDNGYRANGYNGYNGYSGYNGYDEADPYAQYGYRRY